MRRNRDGGLGGSRVQKGGNNGAPVNPKPERLRPREGTPIAVAREQAGEGSTQGRQNSREEILRRFDCRSTGERQDISMARIRLAAKQMAGVIVDEVPYGRERSLAVTKLEEAMFWADAGVARLGARREDETRGQGGDL